MFDPALVALLAAQSFTTMPKLLCQQLEGLSHGESKNHKVHTPRP